MTKFKMSSLKYGFIMLLTSGVDIVLFIGSPGLIGCEKAPPLNEIQNPKFGTCTSIRSYEIRNYKEQIHSPPLVQ